MSLADGPRHSLVGFGGMPCGDPPSIGWGRRLAVRNGELLAENCTMGVVLAYIIQGTCDVGCRAFSSATPMLSTAECITRIHEDGINFGSCENWVF
jgi:hypothetical protein